MYYDRFSPKIQVTKKKCLSTCLRHLLWNIISVVTINTETFCDIIDIRYMKGASKFDFFLQKLWKMNHLTQQFCCKIQDDQKVSVHLVIVL